jgi:hypothetical protein
MFGALEVTRILTGPLALARGLARFATLWLVAIGLCLGVAAVREEENPATPALPFSDAFHDPEPPEQSSDIRTNGERKGLKAGREQKKNQRNYFVKKKKQRQKKKHFHTATKAALSGRPWQLQKVCWFGMLKLGSCTPAPSKNCRVAVKA